MCNQVFIWKERSCNKISLPEALRARAVSSSATPPLPEVLRCCSGSPKLEHNFEPIEPSGRLYIFQGVTAYCPLKEFIKSERTVPEQPLTFMLPEFMVASLVIITVWAEVRKVTATLDDPCLPHHCHLDSVDHPLGNLRQPHSLRRSKSWLNEFIRSIPLKGERRSLGSWIKTP